MGETIQIKEKRNKYAFFVRTFDRVDITRKTLPQIFNQEGVDVLWIDDSMEKDAVKLTENLRGVGLREIQRGYNLGLVGSFVQGIKWMLKNRYEYLGNIDSDVWCDNGWFDSMKATWIKAEVDGLKVGCVSARTHIERILVPRDDYAVMADVGGGMCMYSLEAWLHVLLDKNNCVVHNPMFLMTDINKIFRSVVDMEYPMVKVMKEKEKNMPPPLGGYHGWQFSCDWLWNPLLLQYGLATVAPTPCTAWNIDPDGIKAGAVAKQSIPKDESFDWSKLVGKLKERQGLFI